MRLKSLSGVPSRPLGVCGTPPYFPFRDGQWFRSFLLIVLIMSLGAPALALPDQDRLTLAEAQAKARRVSPELVAAGEAIASAAGWERQAGAFPNPTLVYGYEETSQGGRKNSEHIALIEQPLEIGGQRATRRKAARLRREAAEARLQEAEAQLDFDVARAFALALATDKRVEYATQAVDAFLAAQEISRKRLSEGDVSGYANRRLGLEAARYLGLRAEAMLERRKARLALGALLAPPGEAVSTIETPLADPFMIGRLDASLEDLRDLALQRRAELRALELETQASMADAELASRSRIPTPIAAAGFKTERSAGESGTFDGFVAGVSVPIPLWNRSGGAVAATEAEVRGLKAELHALRRRLVVEVEEAWAGLRTSAEQLDAIRPHLGSELEAAVTAARTAYAEGEISLVEWLDSVRAYNEAQSTFALLKADYLIQRATLERAVGSSIFGGP